MFSFQQSDELVFIDEIPSLISFQEQTNQQDLMVDLHDHVKMVEDTSNTNTNLPPSNSRKRRGEQSLPKPNSTSDVGLGDNKDDDIQKRSVHREIERQRRQEMAKLYASLRGLLPLEFIKENIKVLSNKRVQLKNFSDASLFAPGNAPDKTSINQLPNTVLVTSCNGGVEIMINSCSIEEGFPLSRVLSALIQEGLNVISCNSTKAHKRFLHSIQSEVSDLQQIDLPMLQQRLISIANTRSNFI